MFKVRKLVLAMGCATVLSGCVMNEMWTVRPVMDVKHAARDADSMYRLGRYHQGKVNYKEAIAAYEKALAADPSFVEAHNGLGVVYALQGRHDLAQMHLAKAIELAPRAVHLHNNLGYAYLIQGRDSEAASAFEQALRLEPANPKALANLAIAYERVGLHDKAAMLAAVKPEPVATEVAVKADPVATPEPVARIETAAAPVAVTPAEPAAMPAPVAAQPAPAVVEMAKPEVMRGEEARIVQVSANVFELRMPETATVIGVLASHAAAVQEAANPENRLVKLEVSNGNGLTGMARHVSDFMQKNGFNKARLTNQKPFRQASTEIQYRPGRLEEAERVVKMMPRPVALAESSTLRRDIQVRIVLGKDVLQDVAYFGTLRKTQLARQDAKAAKE